MNKRDIFKIIIIIGYFILCFGNLYAENIDPYEDSSQYAYGENVGWFNFEPSQGPGVTVTKTKVTGYVWAENIGWINLSPSSHGGVNNNSSGNLSGYAWGENVGWINFDPDVPGDTANQYKVSIDSNGKLSGWAWGENIGWVHFDESQSWDVRVCIVTLDDLTNFSSYWFGSNPAADLYLDGTVNMPDFSVFATYWQDYCPDGWQLK